jgi:hypothetical protein
MKVRMLSTNTADILTALMLKLLVYFITLLILWRIDPSLGRDRETNDETTFAARQQILIITNLRQLLGNGLVNTFQQQRIRMQRQSYCWKRGSLRWPVPMSYREDNWATKSVLYGRTHTTVKFFPCYVEILLWCEVF